MSDFLKRSLTGTAFVAVIILGTILNPWLFAVVFISLLLFTLLEFYQLVENAHFSPQKKEGVIIGMLLFLACFLAAKGLIPIESCLVFFPFLTILLLIETLHKNGNTIKNSSITIAGIIYIAVPFSLLNFIVFPNFHENKLFNPWILLGLFFIIWVYDSMAYVGGSLFGKHKMCINISPNKSWEGLITGAVFAVIMGIMNAVFFSSLSLIGWIISAVLIIVFGTFGDLFESKIKRDINVKDSGNMLPGHGGFLDRFDSLLFVIPVIYIWLLIGGNIG